jgi:ureidoacrylate peracid hydrolase
MNFDQIALILVDIQKDFWDPYASEKAFRAFPSNVEKILEKSREKGFTVVHVKSEFQPDRSDWMLFYRPEGRGDIPCIKGKGGTDFTPFSRPSPEEYMVNKQTFDAFLNTGLYDYLKSRNVKAVLIAGLETSVCVLFTATSAYLRKLVPLVIEDACADGLERHEKTLRMYNQLSFITVTTEQVLSDFSSVMKIVERFRK